MVDRGREGWERVVGYGGEREGWESSRIWWREGGVGE